MTQNTSNSPILGLGNDIIEISRIKEGMQEHGQRFLDRLFTPKEQDYCNKYKKDAATHFAGRFSAKEAIAKAFGVGLGEHLSWQDMEILPDEHNRPIVTFSQKAKQHWKDPHVLLSISHCKEYVSTVAIWVNK